MNKEVKLMKNYLKLLVKLNFEQIKKAKPTLDEKGILTKPIKEGEFLDWEKSKDEI